MLCGEFIGHIFGEEKQLEFLPWIKKHILLVPAVGFDFMTSQLLIGGFHTKVNLNHLVTEDWSPL